jgi:hypothetical protein
MIQASARAMQSRYAIHICGSGIPNTNKHLLVKPHDFPLLGNRLNCWSPIERKRKRRMISAQVILWTLVSGTFGFT